MKKTFNNKVCYYEAAREISFEETSIPPLQKCVLPNPAKTLREKERERERTENGRERHKQRRNFSCVLSELLYFHFCLFVV